MMPFFPFSLALPAWESLPKDPLPGPPCWPRPAWGGTSPSPSAQKVQEVPKALFALTQARVAGLKEA